METESGIPSVALLALKYGTISQTEFEKVKRLFRSENNTASPKEILLKEGMATQYQLRLLELIQDYYVVKRDGEEFGRIAVEKGMAVRQDIEKALSFQLTEFRRAKLKKLIGDILVGEGAITLKQRNQILKEQAEIKQRASEIFEKEVPDTDLSLYEKKFLQIRSLDKTFSEKIVEKGLATRRQVDLAQEKQKEAFEKSETISPVGDIMVKHGTITPENRDAVLNRQKHPRPAERKTGKKKITLKTAHFDMMAVVRTDLSDKETATVREIKHLLQEHGVSFGLLSDAVLQCFLENRAAEFPVAYGEFPHEKRERLTTYLFDTEDRKRESVRKGRTIADLGSGGRHLTGKNIYGDPVENRLFKDLDLDLSRCRSGTRLSNDRTKVIASKSGVPSLSLEKNFFVHPFVSLLEDADLRSGPLESYADISISGTLTDAYPVTAGKITANEIRGADVEAVRDVVVETGITGAHIKSQGNVSAAYIKNSTIEAFGDVIVRHEIIDSKIVVSGRVEAGTSRIIASGISAKNGITAGGVGSEVTEPCVLMAGREDHIVSAASHIARRIEVARKELDELESRQKEKTERADHLFKKMSDLKRFHDSVEGRKEKIVTGVNAMGTLSKEDRHKIENLVSDLDNKMKEALRTLHALYKKRRIIEAEQKRLDRKIRDIRPPAEKTTAQLEFDRARLFRWTRNQPVSPRIRILSKCAEHTVFKGVSAEFTAAEAYQAVTVTEQKKSGERPGWQIVVAEG